MPDSDSFFFRWVREHSLLFGVLLGISGGLLILIVVLYDPSSYDQWRRNAHWVRFIAYTGTLLWLLLNTCRPQRPLIGYWTVLIVLLLLHFVGYVWFISRFRPLASIDYVVFGPFEFVLFYFLLDRGRQFLGAGPELSS
jgi:hypothetical protein